MINEGIQNGVNTELMINVKNSCCFVFILVNSKKDYSKIHYQHPVDQDNCIELLKHTDCTTIPVLQYTI